MVEYVVLRNLASKPTAAPFDMAHPMSHMNIGGHIGALVRPEPQIEVHDLTPNDVRDIARDPEVVTMARRMPTMLIKPMDIPPSQIVSTGDAWGIGAVGADHSSRNGSGVTVAVLDTGIDRSHPAFAGVNIIEEDFSGSGNGDRQGHGTHCAGTIFGRDVSGRRIGVARGVQRALIGKVFPDAGNGSGSSEMIFSAMQWAMENGAHVISMSLGFDFPGLVASLTDQGWPTELATSNALEGYRSNLRMFDALMQMGRARGAFGVGHVVVAAAGNESQRNVNSQFEIAVSIPAAAEGVVSVAALTQVANGKLDVTSFSNTFAQISAPGLGILSAWPGGGLRELSGTSMACPHVAGVACLWWEELAKGGAVIPSATNVASRLLATARTDLVAPGVDPADRGVGVATSPI